MAGESLRSVANISLAALIAWSFLPSVFRINELVNIVVTACLTVMTGSYRSLKAEEKETITKRNAMQFPLGASAALFSMFMLVKFLPKLVINVFLNAYIVILGVTIVSTTTKPLVKAFLPSSWRDSGVDLCIPFADGKLRIETADVLAAIPAAFVSVWYVLTRHWILNNVLALTLSVKALELMSLASFKIGAILLAGLFVYDVFWVFCTPVMVTVARSIEAPIKVLFPVASTSRPFAMLGLGDIVIPGIFVALALRYDESKKTGLRYFISSFIGYALGLISTVTVMKLFNAAQPALLYIVPSLFAFLFGHSYINGDLKSLFEFQEDPKEDEDGVEQAESTAEEDTKEE